LTEVAPGLFAISQWVALDGNISWVPRSARGWEPSTVYLVDGGEEALLYDTGLPVHRSAILEQLAERVGDRELALWTSRLVEPDSVGNVVPVLERLKVRRIMNATQSNQLRLVTHRWHEFTSENGYSVERLQWGERFRVGTRELEVIQPAARVIATSWLYDLESRVLLSSDFFGHLHRSEVATSPVFEGAAQASSVEQVREHLLAKYEWLRGADVAAICQSLEAIFADREIASIAPGHGCIISGEEAVRRHYQLTLEALQGPRAGGAAGRLNRLRVQAPKARCRAVRRGSPSRRRRSRGPGPR